MLHWFARLYLWACHRLYNEFAWAYDWVSWLVSLGHWWGWRLAALDHVCDSPHPGPLPSGEGVCPPLPARERRAKRGGEGEIGPRVLEVGFGTGDLLIEMARRGWAVWGLDLSPAMHRITARKLRKHGLRVPRTRAWAEAMPFPDAAFDAVVATFPAEFILQRPALCEFARVLRSPDPAEGRPGGRLIVTGASFVVDDPALHCVFQRVFGSAAADQRFAWIEHVAQAGLQVSVVEQPGRWVRPQIIIAEKPGGVQP